MKKSLFVAAIAALALVACKKTETVETANAADSAAVTVDSAAAVVDSAASVTVDAAKDAAAATTASLCLWSKGQRVAGRHGPTSAFKIFVISFGRFKNKIKIKN